MDSSTKPYKTPRQRRSRESLERLLDAAEQQIREEGIENLTVNSVVSRVGLSVGAFYARFPDKTALIHAVQERFHESFEPILRAQLVEASAPCKNLKEAVEATLDVLIRYVTGEWELSRAFMTLSVFDPAMKARGETVNRGRRQVFTEILLAHRDEIGHADPVLAIDVAYGMYAALVRGRLIFGMEHELNDGFEHTAIYSELKQALYLYLRGER